MSRTDFKDRRQFPNEPTRQDGHDFADDAVKRIRFASATASLLLRSARTLLGEYSPLARDLADIQAQLALAEQDVADSDRLWSSLSLNMARQGTANVLRAALAGAAAHDRQMGKPPDEALEAFIKGDEREAP